MRARIAKFLVKVCGRWYDASYSAYCRVDRGELPEKYHDFWAAAARKVNAKLLPLAIKFDSTAATIQMIEEGWWG